MNRALIPGHNYNFIFEYKNPLEHTINPIFGNIQSFIPGVPFSQEGYTLQRSGYFITMYKNQYVFYSKHTIELNNASTNTEERLYFIVNLTRILSDTGKVPLSSNIIEAITYFIMSPNGPHLINQVNNTGYEPYDTEMVINFERIQNQIKLNKLNTIKKKISIRKLKQFLINSMSRPPETYINTHTSKSKSWVGPLYQRAANSFAKHVHGSSRRTRKRENKQRRTRKR